jgi:hypothetical protein
LKLSGKVIEARIFSRCPSTFVLYLVEVDLD